MGYLNVLVGRGLVFHALFCCDVRCALRVLASAPIDAESVRLRSAGEVFGVGDGVEEVFEVVDVAFGQEVFDGGVGERLVFERVASMVDSSSKMSGSSSTSRMHRRRSGIG
jgi:hypothetical protein